jgi:hypothetical protein
MDAHARGVPRLPADGKSRTIAACPPSGRCAEDVGGGDALIVGRSCPTSRHTSNDEGGANSSCLDNLGIKLPRATIIGGRLNDT